MDEHIDNFMAFTGSNADVARRYLGLTENNFEQAIQLFFDSPDLGGPPPPASAPPIPTSSRPSPQPSRTRHKDLIEVSDDEGDTQMSDDDDDEASMAAAVARAAEVEDDEAIARRMQEELYAGGDASGGFDTDGVRAPIGRTTETLVGGHDGGWTPEDMDAAVLQQLRNRARPGGSSCKVQRLDFWP